MFGLKPLLGLEPMAPIRPQLLVSHANHSATETSICMYVCMCLCMYVCMYVCVRVHACMHACMCVYVCMYVCMHECVSVCEGTRCSSVVRAFVHDAMGRRIDPSWGGPIELFLAPASAPRLV